MTHLKLRTRVARATAAAVLAVIIGSCAQPLSIDDVEVKPTSFAAVGNTAFTATVGTAITNQGQVRVLDQDGEPMSGLSVSFSASGGTIAPNTPVQTNSQGIAAPGSWTTPTTAGSATLTASLPGSGLSNVVFNVTLTAGPASTVVATAGNNQTSAAGSSVATAPAVRVTDQHGNGIAGVTVAFSVLTGGGTINGTTATTANVTTSATGLAAVTSWTLGQTAGANTLRAVAAGLPSSPVTFTATGVAGPPASIVIAPGTPTSQGQSAGAGQPVAVAPSVLVRDQFSNPVSGATVRFTVSAGGGKVLAGSGDATGSNALDAVSSASGIATVFGWRLGNPGANTLSVTIPAVSSVPAFNINAIGEAGTPTQIAIVTETPSSNNQSAQIDSAVAVGPAVIVRDVDNFIAPNVDVTFTVGANSGTIKGTSTSTAATTATIKTDVNGVARLHAWNLGQRGANTLTAAITANTALNVTFNATGTAGPPVSIEIVAETPSSNNQTTIAGTSVAVAPAVLLKDAAGLTVDAGHDVTFTILTGGGTVSATAGGAGSTTATVQTNASGVARLGYWKPGTVGANTLRAAVDGVTPALTQTFTATGTVGPPSSLTFTNSPWANTRQSTANGGQPKVTVTDAGGNLLSGITVVWTNNGNTNSTVTGSATSITNSSGVATFGGNWVAGATAGVTMQLLATAQGTSISAVASSVISGAPTNVLVQVGAPASTTVATKVNPSPTVIIRDSGNRPVPGASVTWTYPTNPGSTGTLLDGGSPPAASDSIGRLVLSTWRVAQTAGNNIVQVAVNGTSVTQSFSTTGLGGTPTSMAINAGNGQSAAIGQAVATDPSVIVRDQFNNVVSGASVTFQPTTGSGTVTGGTQTTNATGIATVTSWTLSGTAGTKTLNAFLTSNSSIGVTFTATAIDPCVTATNYTLGSFVFGTLSSTGDCTTGSGTTTHYQDLYQFTTGTGTTQLLLTYDPTTSYEPTLWSRIWGTAAWGWRSGTAGNPVSARLILAGGTYTFEAASHLANITGSYEITSTVNPVSPSGCGEFLTTKGITVSHTLDATCTYTSQNQSTVVNSKIYILYLPANSGATVRMNAGGVSDPYLECFDVTASYGSPVYITNCFNDDASGLNSVMTVPTSTSARYVLIRASHHSSATSKVGSYTLTIDP